MINHSLNYARLTPEGYEQALKLIEANGSTGENREKALAIIGGEVCSTPADKLTPIGQLWRGQTFHKAAPRENPATEDVAYLVIGHAPCEDGGFYQMVRGMIVQCACSGFTHKATLQSDVVAN